MATDAALTKFGKELQQWLRDRKGPRPIHPDVKAGKRPAPAPDTDDEPTAEEQQGVGDTQGVL